MEATSALFVVSGQLQVSGKNQLWSIPQLKLEKNSVKRHDADNLRIGGKPLVRASPAQA